MASSSINNSNRFEASPSLPSPSRPFGNISNNQLTTPLAASSSSSNREREEVVSAMSSPISPVYLLFASSLGQPQDTPPSTGGSRSQALDPSPRSKSINAALVGTDNVHNDCENQPPTGTTSTPRSLFKEKLKRMLGETAQNYEVIERQEKDGTGKKEETTQMTTVSPVVTSRETQEDYSPVTSVKSMIGPTGKTGKEDKDAASDSGSPMSTGRTFYSQKPRLRNLKHAWSLPKPSESKLLVNSRAPAHPKEQTHPTRRKSDDSFRSPKSIIPVVLGTSARSAEMLQLTPDLHTPEMQPTPPIRSTTRTSLASMLISSMSSFKSEMGPEPLIELEKSPVVDVLDNKTAGSPEVVALEIMSSTGGRLEESSIRSRTPDVSIATPAASRHSIEDPYALQEAPSFDEDSPFARNACCSSLEVPVAFFPDTVHTPSPATDSNNPDTARSSKKRIFKWWPAGKGRRATTSSWAGMPSPAPSNMTDDVSDEAAAAANSSEGTSRKERRPCTVLLCSCLLLIMVAIIIPVSAVLIKNSLSSKNSNPVHSAKGEGGPLPQAQPSEPFPSIPEDPDNQVVPSPEPSLPPLKQHDDGGGEEKDGEFNSPVEQPATSEPSPDPLQPTSRPTSSIPSPTPVSSLQPTPAASPIVSPTPEPALEEPVTLEESVTPAPTSSIPASSPAATPIDPTSPPTKQPIDSAPAPTAEPTFETIAIDQGVWAGFFQDASYPWVHVNAGLRLEVRSAVQDHWQPFVNEAVADWSGSNALELTMTRIDYQSQCFADVGFVKICNADYGDTGWKGLTLIYLRGSVVVASSIRLNDFYAMTEEWNQFNACHQLGHAFGLTHSNGDSCMTNSIRTEPTTGQQHPDQSNLNDLVGMYGRINGLRKRHLKSRRRNRTQIHTSPNFVDYLPADKELDLGDGYRVQVRKLYTSDVKET
jgi:hypothetical protein